MLKKKKLIYLLVPIIGLLLIVMLVIYGSNSKEVNADDSTSEGIAVNAEKAQLGKLKSDSSISGNLEAGIQVDVFPKMGGEVVQTNVKVGDKVSQGQTLFKLESSQLAAALKQAEAGLAVAKASAPSNQDRADTSLKTAEANYLNAKDNYERMKALYEQGAISQQEFESVKLQYDLALAQFDSAKEQTGLTSDTSQASVKQAEAALEAARANYNNSVIKAPVGGTVAAVNVSTGETASPSAAITTIVDISEMMVKATVSESDINNIKVGQEVDVLVKTVSDKPFVGKIKEISLVPDSSKAYPIKVTIKNDKGLLKAGMFAEVNIGSEREEEILIPIDAVLDREGEKIVYIIEKDKAVEKKVKLGHSNSLSVEILSGLKEGDQVIVKGQNFVKDGSPVKIVK